MKNFDVELAKKGWPVVMRDETSARIICYDKRDPRPIVALYMMCDAEIVSDHYINGRYNTCSESDFDLFLADTWEGHDENGDPIGCDHSQKDSTLSTQVGGDHYTKRAIQPWEYIEANGLDFFEGNIVKYITRYKDKDGVKDLRKAKHYIEYLIER